MANNSAALAAAASLFCGNGNVTFGPDSTTLECLCHPGYVYDDSQFHFDTCFLPLNAKPGMTSSQLALALVLAACAAYFCWKAKTLVRKLCVMSLVIEIQLVIRFILELALDIRWLNMIMYLMTMELIICGAMPLLLYSFLQPYCLKYPQRKLFLKQLMRALAVFCTIHVVITTTLIGVMIWLDVDQQYRVYNIIYGATHLLYASTGPPYIFLVWRLNRQLQAEINELANKVSPSPFVAAAVEDVTGDGLFDGGGQQEEEEKGGKQGCWELSLMRSHSKKSERIRESTNKNNSDNKNEGVKHFVKTLEYVLWVFIGVSLLGTATLCAMGIPAIVLPAYPLFVIFVYLGALFEHEVAAGLLIFAYRQQRLAKSSSDRDKQQSRQAGESQRSRDEPASASSSKAASKEAALVPAAAVVSDE